MLRKFCRLACALGLLAAWTGNAHAATIGSVMVAGADSRLSDNSLEVLWNQQVGGGFNPSTIGTGDTIVSVGDRLVAIGRIDQVTSPFPAGPTYTFPAGWNEELTFVSVIEVTGKTAMGGGAYRFEFGATSTTDPLGLGWQDGTAIAFYSDPSNDYSGAPTSIVDGLTEAGNGDAWWEFGFDGEPGEFWVAPYVLSDNIAAIRSLPKLAAGGFFNFGLNLLEQNAGLGLVPVFGSLEITGSGALLGAGGRAPGGWHVLDNYDAVVRTAAVPEPSSMAVFALFGAAGLARRFRRK